MSAPPPIDPGVDPADERGDGLSVERTELAWTRSGIALLGAFAILTRRVWTEGVGRGDALAVALLAVATLGWAVGILGWRTVHRGATAPSARPERPRSPRELLAVTAGTVALAAAGLVVTFVD